MPTFERCSHFAALDMQICRLHCFTILGHFVPRLRVSHNLVVYLLADNDHGFASVTAGEKLREGRCGIFKAVCDMFL
jgi:hypothetical protein